MEPIGVASDVVSLETLPRWSSLPVPDYDKSRFKDTSTPTPFTCDPSINEKVVIWMGDLSLLDTTAIVVTTNETFTEKNRLVDRVNRRAGSKLLTECRNHLRGKLNIVEMFRMNVILFFVSLLNSVANRRYIIVYFSSLAEPDNMPEWLLMRRLYVCLSQKYRKNLAGLYVVHPTFWSKMVTWYQTTFNFAEIKDKVQLLGGVEYLYHFVDPQEIVVPNFVLDYDFKGHSLAARHVIFTVGPRYNVRYQTAAESALYSCYRNVLQLFREHNMSTLGLCTVHSARRGYPPAEGAHITLRTIRRFLEKYGATVETIVLCMEDTTIEAVYMKLMPLYFPRDDDETRHSATNLPADVGNEDGEPVVVDRQVRITGKPEYKGAVGECVHTCE
ncbi:PREDICTED: protein GDAP2 homolog [Priapulus caudatus]|uniref:Protein GDAP2 homolog n=1 Tax=Priapulus caudatus TaxID=37621 RepID=A0ABM1EIB2_PRICU|nr:PREDICTED: protein GDAP2 homolog [Priapulus caudatus]